MVPPVINGRRHVLFDILIIGFILAFVALAVFGHVLLLTDFWPRPASGRDTAPVSQMLSPAE